MVEVLFSAGAAESMECAKNIQTRHCANEIVCLDYMLDVGDILQPPDSDYRQGLIVSMHMQGKPDGSRESREKLRAQLRQYQEYPRLKALLAEGNDSGHKKAIRIWHSQEPYDFCGLRWLCHELRNVEVEVSVIDLPEYHLRADTYIEISKGWSEVPSEAFGDCLNRQRQLTMPERRMYAMDWEKALKDNSPLRAVVSGRLLSVPEDFYDFLILRRITGRPEAEARIIGDIIGSSQIDVRDWWYAFRIQRLIEDGRIQVAKGSESDYGRLICTQL